MPKHDPYAALRLAPYRRLLSGSMAMHLANQAVGVALGWTLYERTHSAWPLAMVGLATYLPIFFFTLPAGYLADHRDRRWLMRLTLGGMFLGQASLALAAHLDAPLWVWYALVFVWATARAVHTPVAVSFYPSLVPEKAVANAVTWASSNFQAGAIVGPLLGGVLLSQWGPELTLAFSAAGPALYLLLLPFIQPLRKAPPAAGREALLSRVLGGWRFMRKEKAILAALSLDFVAVLIGGCEAILPIFAKDILHVGPVGLGWLRSASFAGNLCMGVYLAHRPPLRQAGKAMLLAVAGFGLALAVFSLSTNFWLSLAALFASGCMDGISIVVRQTLVQVRTPESLRGRVQAVNFLFVGSSNELGEFESGLAAALLGPVAAVLLGSLGTLAVVAVVAWKAKELRQLGRLDRGRA